MYEAKITAVMETKIFPLWTVFLCSFGYFLLAKKSNKLQRELKFGKKRLTLFIYKNSNKVCAKKRTINISKNPYDITSTSYYEIELKLRKLCYFVN